MTRDQEPAQAWSRKVMSGDELLANLERFTIDRSFDPSYGVFSIK